MKPNSVKCQYCDQEFAWDDVSDYASQDEKLAASGYWKRKRHLIELHSEHATACPRQAEGGPLSREPVFPHEDGSCGYCGSLSPEQFFEAIERGDEIGPTDKSYKAYVDVPDPNVGTPRVVGSASRRPSGDGWIEVTAENRDSLPVNHYHQNGSFVLIQPTSARRQAKFYFQHLSREQQQRFIDLLNEKKVNIGYPGHFYSRPFFIAPPKPRQEDAA